jgi:hypothetical protein
MSDAGSLPPWTCTVCGETHDELPAAAVPAPYYWDQASEEERAAEFELTADTGVWND